MGKLGFRFLETLKSWVVFFAWPIFLWGIGKTDEQYWREIAEQEATYNGAEMSVQGIVWRKDDCGDYWTADLFRDGKKMGLTGNYYDVGKDGQRPSREDTIIPFRVSEDNSKLDKR